LSSLLIYSFGNDLKTRKVFAKQLVKELFTWSFHYQFENEKFEEPFEAISQKNLVKKRFIVFFCSLKSHIQVVIHKWFFLHLISNILTLGALSFCDLLILKNWSINVFVCWAYPKTFDHNFFGLGRHKNIILTNGNLHL